tara:strand:+ start:48 stop:236 length:189 start_codon:yes stop_codon:yes gene_type:complete
MQNITTNVFSGVLALVTIAVIGAIVIATLWLIPILIVIAGGIGLFFVFRILLEDTEKGEADH